MATPTTNHTLLTRVSQIQSLLNHFTTTLASPVPGRTSDLPPTNAPNPLHVLRDSSKLLYAHATKIGLLLINEPFTSSAVHKELLACQTECLPSMMSAVEVCHPALWTATLAKEVRLRVDAVMSSFGALLADVRSKAEGENVRFDTSNRKEKTLASTGQVWAACDTLVVLEKHGIAGCIAKKAQEYRDMLKDAIEELKEWSEDEDDQDEGFVGSDDEADGELDGMFSGARLPTHRRDLKDHLQVSLRKLKLIDMLFQAVIKRRVKTFHIQDSPTTEDLQRVDVVIDDFKSISESVDELANAFYELDIEQATYLLEQTVSNAKAAAERQRKSWSCADDEFTAWELKWREAIVKPETTGKG